MGKITQSYLSRISFPQAKQKVGLLSPRITFEGLAFVATPSYLVIKSSLTTTAPAPLSRQNKDKLVPSDVSHSLISDNINVTESWMCAQDVLSEQEEHIQFIRHFFKNHAVHYGNCIRLEGLSYNIKTLPSLIESRLTKYTFRKAEFTALMHNYSCLCGVFPPVSETTSYSCKSYLISVLLYFKIDSFLPTPINFSQIQNIVTQ